MGCRVAGATPRSLRTQNDRAPATSARGVVAVTQTKVASESTLPDKFWGDRTDCTSFERRHLHERLLQDRSRASEPQEMFVLTKDEYVLLLDHALSSEADWVVPGRPGYALLIGDAGFGKTHLLAKRYLPEAMAKGKARPDLRTMEGQSRALENQDLRIRELEQRIRQLEEKPSREWLDLEDKQTFRTRSKIVH